MICTAEALAKLIAHALDCERVALDTEFVWNRTYYPKLGVIQLALANGDCYLIDPVAIADLSPLGALLEHPKVELILHDAQQDLAILRRATGAFPRNVFDTRCAAGFANMSSTTSLAELLEQTLGVVLDKTETLTNWVRRPLSEDQLAYAIEDVRYLHETRDVLQARVEEIGRSTWLTEEMAAYDDPQLYEELRPTRAIHADQGHGPRFPARVGHPPRVDRLARRGSPALRPAAQSRIDGRSPRVTSPAQASVAGGTRSAPRTRQSPL